MKTADLNKVKGDIKTAMQDWANSKIDELFPGKATAKQFMKNGVNNLMNRYDQHMNEYIDKFFMFVADEKGEIDSDVMVDTVVGIFKEIDPIQQYHLGMVDVTVGKGELGIHLPDNMFLNMLVGSKGVIKFTADDILDFKNLLN
jgi:hypothetical protein